MSKLPNRSAIPLFVGMAFLLALLLPLAIAQDLEYKETVIAGGPDKFVEVRHVVLKGSNFDIGKKIGEIAKRNGATITPSDALAMTAG